MANALSKILSVVLHPLWASIWLLLLFRWNNHPDFFRISNLAFRGIFFGFLGFSVIFPLIAVFWLMVTKRISSLYMQTRTERHFPYLAACLGLFLLTYWLHQLPISPLFYSMTLGAAVATTFVFFINLKWKISAHATGIGGIIGGYLSQHALLEQYPSLLLISLLLLLSGLLGCARIYLKAHSPSQWFAGFILGFLNLYYIHYFI